jgi:glutathione S-transferase
MKLYYNPYGCSLAVMIAAAEARMPLELVFVDILSDPHTLADGRDYSAINARNYVPLLEFESGERISEVAAILQVLADKEPNTGLAPAAGTSERVRLQEWLTFLGTELHKFYSPWLFHPEVGETAQGYARAKIASRYSLIDQHLAGRDYILDRFSVADAYLFVMTNWAAFAKTPLDAFPNLRAWFERMKARPAVMEALRLHSRMPAAKAA